MLYSLKKLGGANIVQDLYGWERSDYTSQHIKPTFIFEIQEAVEQIKDSSQVDNNRNKLSERKQSCMKIANSHKILRFCVYSGKGVDELKKIAWLNMKNLKNAIKIVK